MSSGKETTAIRCKRSADNSSVAIDGATSIICASLRNLRIESYLWPSVEIRKYDPQITQMKTDKNNDGAVWRHRLFGFTAQT
ncbi:MAG: hypothetical protein ACRD4L_13490 [Pyrinomonadaceae bacterium]